MRNSPTMFPRTTAALLLAALVLPLSACITEGRARELDARFEAGWRPSKAACTFGGETPTLDAYCAQLNFGAGGLEVIARAANENLLSSAAGQPLPCTEHVAMAREQLAAYTQYKFNELYSCDNNPPVQDGKSVCHVSLLVSDPVSGARIVMDNGHVLTPGIYSGVAPYAEFAQLVDRHWSGRLPAWIALAQQ